MTDHNEIAAALAHVPAHDRDTWVRMGMAIKSELGEAGFDLWNDWSQLADNYHAKSAKAVWKGIKAGGKVSIASLFHEAKANGWTPAKPYAPPTPEQRAALEAERQAAAEAAAEIEHQQREAAKAKAARLWDTARDVAADHPYLTAKGIKPEGAKQLRDMLVLPIRLDGELVNLQLIGADGSKRFLTGGQVKGGSLVLGWQQGAERAILCEGWATGCSLRAATGLPVVVAFNANNLPEIARRMAAKLPDLELIVAGDNDASGTGQRAALKAAQAHTKASWCVPAFSDQHQQQHGKPPSDFNDLHRLVGLDEVVRQIAAATKPEVVDQTKPDNSNNEDALIADLAALPVIQYERRRAGAAEALGIRASVLDKLVSAARKERESVTDADQGSVVLFDDLEPWPDPVDGATVLDEVFGLLQRYVIADKETLRAAALWCSLTWLIDRATVMPIALISAPEKGCGKSVMLEALSHLCFKPLPVASVSAAAMFRAIEKWQPTLFIDEVDTFMRDNPELVGVINSGHTRRNAFVLRTVGDDYEPKAFSTWCAKAISGIAAKNLTDSLVSRSIIFNLRRKLPNEKTAPLRRDSGRHFTNIKRKLMRWAQDIADQFAATVPDPFGLNNRAADNWEGLVVLADIAGGSWPAWARHAAHYISGSVEAAPSVNQELLTDIQAAFTRRKTDKLHTAQLLAELCSDDESAWATYNRGRELSAKQLCSRLAEFGVKPKQIWISGEGNRRGYELGQFEDAFSRYLAVETQDVNLKNFLPPPLHGQHQTLLHGDEFPIGGNFPARTLDANNGEGYSRFSPARTSTPLAGEKPLQANIHAGSSVLAGEAPQTAMRDANLAANDWMDDYTRGESKGAVNEYF